MFSLLLAVNHIAFYGATSLTYSPIRGGGNLTEPMGTGNLACCGVQ